MRAAWKKMKAAGINSDQGLRCSHVHVGQQTCQHIDDMYKT